MSGRPSARQRKLLPFAVAFSFIGVFAVAPVLAQNENETVEFSSTHVFDGGLFGEQIDTLNGNLTLTMPIGPNYQNPYLNGSEFDSYVCAPRNDQRRSAMPRALESCD